MEADSVLPSLQLLEVYEGRPDTQAGLADAPASKGGGERATLSP